ncbi:hypothetical protein AAT19DRAFT_8476 [Rhodotorula toruloides]|uniref:Uncharacterized protein n=1 Tax=Rhodotorula toruloides TaxID=5286 RepID=A0A2T0AHC2_RHOTO|nr:hypothetical protein AAT19DRAFT_8476 [Rhodotorula toruloides]
MLPSGFARSCAMQLDVLRAWRIECASVTGRRRQVGEGRATYRVWHPPASASAHSSACIPVPPTHPPPPAPLPRHPRQTPAHDTAFARRSSRPPSAAERLVAVLRPSLGLGSRGPLCAVLCRCGQMSRREREVQVMFGGKGGQRRTSRSCRQAIRTEARQRNDAVRERSRASREVEGRAPDPRSVPRVDEDDQKVQRVRVLAIGDWREE